MSQSALLLSLLCSLLELGSPWVLQPPLSERVLVKPEVFEGVGECSQHMDMAKRSSSLQYDMGLLGTSRRQHTPLGMHHRGMSLKLGVAERPLS